MMGKLQQFDIQFGRPDGIYRAGETMTGQVVVELGEEMKIKCETCQNNRSSCCNPIVCLRMNEHRLVDL